MLAAFPAPGRDFDAAVVAAAVATMFCDYPEGTVRAVSDPARGLPSELRYFPTIAEVKAALEALEAPKRVRLANENRIRETQRYLAAPKAEASPEERERAFERWQAQKAEMQGKDRKSPELVKAEADALLREGWRDQRWNTNSHPVQVSNELRRNLAAKADPNYVPLSSGQGRTGGNS